MRSALLLSICLLLVQASWAQNPKDSTYYAKRAAPGAKMISVYKGKYKVFTQKAGSGNIQLLLLHGGPGHGHEYFENFPEQLKPLGVTVYFYDQLGCYFSDQPEDATIWKADRFVEEVEEVRKGLKLDNFYLLGHSWGGMLAELYAAKYGQHLKGVILSNVPGFSTKDPSYFFSVLDSVDRAAHEIALNLPRFATQRAQLDSIQRKLKLSDTLKARLLYKQFNKANDSVYGRTMYYHKAGPLPEPYRRSMRHIENFGIDKYHFDHLSPDYMEVVKKISTPTLLLGARYDFLHAERYERIKKTMTKAKVRVEICPNGAHFTMWDDTDNYFNAVRRFLKEVESKTFNP